MAKVGGLDPLVPEMFITCREILTPILCSLFNYMYNNSSYPDSWSKGVIYLYLKVWGGPNNVNNYRCITLSSIFSKIFSILLDSRLRKWAETNTLLSEFQFGCRKKRYC